MTKEKAIEQLQNCKELILQNDKDWLDERDIPIIDMAIEALENKPTPCEKCIHVKSCRKVIILKNRTYKLVRYCSQGAERKNHE